MMGGHGGCGWASSGGVRPLNVSFKRIGLISEAQKRKQSGNVRPCRDSSVPGETDVGGEKEKKNL